MEYLEGFNKNKKKTQKNCLEYRGPPNKNFREKPHGSHPLDFEPMYISTFLYSISITMVLTAQNKLIATV